MTPQGSQFTMSSAYENAQTRTINVNGTNFVYRQLGPEGGVPVILLHHLTAVLDNWDPRIVDGLATKHRVIAFDNRGVGASGGKTPDSVEAMAQDAIAFIRTLGFDKVDILGFSLGGMVAQVVARQEPQLVRRLILAGTGPAGGEGIDKVTSVTLKDMAKAGLTLKDPKYYLFFTSTANGRQAARDFLKRLKERRSNRDKAISPFAFRAQLKAIHKWGLRKDFDLTAIKQPVLVVNGDNDRMVPSINSSNMAKQLPDSKLVLYPDAGHGGIFQYHKEFVKTALEFLK